MRFGLLTALTIAMILPIAASAQSPGGTADGGDTPFIISVDPQYPAPYRQATLSFLSPSLDLSNATMSVSVNGKNTYQGDVQPVTVTLGKAGTSSNVVVTISSGGTQYTQSVSLQPQDISLIAEPISSAPPLYPGKPSIPLEGNVRIVAVANLKSTSGKATNPSSYSYAWTVDGAKISNSSGIGKNTIIVASPLQYRARTISVSVQSSDGSLAGGASLTFSPENPSVRIYRNDPLLGILFDHALADSYSITGAEVTLYAAPFSLPTTAGAPLVQWFLNGAAAQTGTSITLRPSGKGQGSASLSLVASAGQYARATMSLPLLFGETTSSNFFGL